MYHLDTTPPLAKIPLLCLWLQVPCFARDAVREVPGHTHRYHHVGLVVSLPSAMLGAAMRAAARDGTHSSRNSEVEALLPQIPAPSMDSSSSNSSNTGSSNGARDTLWAALARLQKLSRG